MTTILHSIYTAARAESEYGLQPGTVRQYIKRHPELVRSGEFVKADARTWIMHRDTIERIWGRDAIERLGYGVEAYDNDNIDPDNDYPIRWIVYRAFAPDGTLVVDDCDTASQAYNAARTHYTQTQ